MASETGANDAFRPVSTIVGVQGVPPPNRYSQAEITEEFLKFPAFADHGDIVRSLHRSAKVTQRQGIGSEEAKLETYHAVDALRRAQADGSPSSSRTARPALGQADPPQLRRPVGALQGPHQPGHRSLPR